MSDRLSSFIPSFVVENPIYRDRGARVLLFTLGLGYFLTKLVTYGSAALAPLFYRERDLIKRYGKDSWAFVTGASDGIGKAFAIELARRGFNVILLGRNREKLEDVENKIKAESPQVKTKILVHDLKYCYKEGYMEEVFHEVRDLDISILINNAGLMLNCPYYKASIEEIRDNVIVNCLSAALVLRIVLPKLTLRSHRSAIINLSSKVSTFPRPFQQLYGASKAFVEYLSLGINYEHPNIDSLALKPAQVNTRMNDNKPTDMKIITPEDVVEAGLMYLGRQKQTYGHWKHRWATFYTDLLPESWRLYWFQQKHAELRPSRISFNL